MREREAGACTAAGKIKLRELREWILPHFLPRTGVEKWQNQLCLSFSSRIVNSRVCLFHPAPTELKFCEKGVLLRRDEPNLPGSVPHPRTAELDKYVSAKCLFLAGSQRVQSSFSFAGCVAQLGPRSSGLCPNIFKDFLSEAGSKGTTHLSQLRLLVLWKQRCNHLSAETKITIERSCFWSL